MTKFIPTKFRTHKLSFIPGGVTVLVTMITGESRIYDKVHYPLQYITEILEKSGKDMLEIKVNDKPFWHRNRTINYVHEEPKRRLVPLVRVAA